MNETKRLYRVEKGSMIAGVCGGIAEYFNIDPSLVRIAAAALFFAGTLSFWVTWYAPSSCPRRAISTPAIKSARIKTRLPDKRVRCKTSRFATHPLVP